MGERRYDFPMGKIIMHIDLNAFFATAEEIRHPELSGQPIIVGGDGPRSVVSTASYAARKFGVHSAMPIFEAKRLCPQGVFLPCDFSYYSMLSRSFFAFLHAYSPLIETASIDECYVDMTKPMRNLKDPENYLRELQMALFNQIGLKCSIGLSPTKFLAKMASDMKKPMGVTILRKRDIEAKLYPLPIESFYGIGKKTAPRLRALGITTIGDFAALAKKDDPALKRELGKFFALAKLDVLGEGPSDVDPTPFEAKSLGHSETFPYDTSDEYEIKSKIRELAYEVSEDVKRERKKGKGITLVVKDSLFHTHDKSVTLAELTDSFEEIKNRALSLFDDNFLGLSIRLVGVTLTGLMNPKDQTVQMSIWNYGEFEEMDETKLLVNKLNRRFKKDELTTLGELKKKGKNGNK